MKILLSVHSRSIIVIYLWVEFTKALHHHLPLSLTPSLNIYFPRGKKPPPLKSMPTDKDTPVYTAVRSTIVYLWVEFAEASSIIYLLRLHQISLIFLEAKKKNKKKKPISPPIKKTDNRWRYSCLYTQDQSLSSTCEWSTPKPSIVIYHSLSHLHQIYLIFKKPTPPSKICRQMKTSVCTAVRSTIVYLCVEFAEASSIVHLSRIHRKV